MPAQYKLLVSVLALIACGVLFYIDSHMGAGAERWVVALLGPLMVFAIWIFPEAKSREIRREAAKRR